MTLSGAMTADGYCKTNRHILDTILMMCQVVLHQTRYSQIKR